MNERGGRPWPVYALGAATIGAIVAAYLVVGPASQTTASTTRIVTAREGVVQSTVSGSGNVEAARQLDLGFKTSGVVSHIFVSQGQHVVKGELLAELDPESAEVSLEQARASLKTAQATLAQEEETGGEPSSSSAGAGSSAGSGARAASLPHTTIAAATSATATGTSGTSSAAAPEAGAGSGRRPAPGSPSSSPATETTSASRSVATTTTATSTAALGATSSSSLSSAARAANLASARAAVKSDRLAVQSARQALSDTNLYAPLSGTLVSLSGEVGETVSATGTTRAASSSSSEGSSSAAGAAASAFGASSAASGGTGGSGSGSGSGSASSFAVLSDLSSMQMVVPMSESEIGEVKTGQPATVTVEALEGRKMAAEVTAISDLPTSNSGVVSYDVTFTLSQLTAGLRPGMSATAEVVVKQAEGVNVPTSAITAGQVTVVKEGRQTRRSVVTGLAGNASTIVISGLSAGEEVALPNATTSGSSANSLLSRLGSRLGGGGLGGAGGGLGAGGAFRGGLAVRALGG